MDKITVIKEELIPILEKNREAHRAIFEEAIAGFREKVIVRLDEMIEAAKANKHFDQYIGLARPDDHTKDYDRVIQMLKMDTSATVTLDQRDFVAFVQDDWGWREQWLASNSMYSATAARMSESS